MADNESRRGAIVRILDEDDEPDVGLRDLGIQEGHVYQADTLESPTQEDLPLIVVRWLDSQPGAGSVERAPFDIWCYGKKGDFTTPEKVGKRVIALMNAVLQEPLIGDGLLMVVETKGAGLGRGQDLYDDQWDSPVIPFRCRAVGRGL